MDWEPKDMTTLPDDAYLDQPHRCWKLADYWRFEYDRRRRKKIISSSMQDHKKTLDEFRDLPTDLKKYILTFYKSDYKPTAKCKYCKKDCITPLPLLWGGMRCCSYVCFTMWVYNNMPVNYIRGLFGQYTAYMPVAGSEDPLTAEWETTLEF